jgi:four helix bundle protein
MSGFRELVVWQKSKALAVAIYKLTSQGGFARDFGLRDQIRRAAVSIPSNIAEGDERDTNKDSVRFLYIAKGSLAELITQLEIAHEIGYLSKDELAIFDQKCSEIGRMLGSLIKARSQTTKPITDNL